MRTQCKKCFALPFAEIMITADLYLLCLVFAEEQGSAMPEMVPVHSERGQLRKLHCPGRSRHSAILPKPQQQGCFMTISRVTPAL